MKRVIFLMISGMIITSGCATLKDAVEKEKASRAMPAGLQGTWEHKGYLGYKMTIANKDFTLEVFDRNGKQLRKFIGFIKDVDNRKNLIAAHLQQLFQGGKNLTGTLQGNYYKVFYYKELTGSSVKIFMLNGMVARKNLGNYDDEAKIDRKYNQYNKL